MTNRDGIRVMEQHLREAENEREERVFNAGHIAIATLAEQVELVAAARNSYVVVGESIVDAETDYAEILTAIDEANDRLHAALMPFAEVMV